jgi:signal transduction histidine kinase
MQVRNALGDPAKAEQHCEQVDLSISRAMKELRSLTYLLHPQSLFEGGLKITIERYAEGFAARTGLMVDASISPLVDNLSPEKQQSLMRIVQEALTNVYRHARATRADITIEAKESQFRLEIRDDGQGMMTGNTASQLRSPTLGTGLRILQARVEKMHGRLEILSAPTAVRQGTILRAELPACFWRRAERRRCALKKSR